ncbi:MAG: hypothetical protein U9M97_01040, partial [Candidatus Hadarchaeota archaeon]|nr:hypothetical protein [Candidatus Hadarchaeota archaeon]
SRKKVADKRAIWARKHRALSSLNQIQPAYGNFIGLSIQQNSSDLTGQFSKHLRKCSGCDIIII